jgi:Arc/MetJ-type ribon-helix-helix transcriptional regulator
MMHFRYTIVILWIVILIKFGIIMEKRIIFRLPDEMDEQINALVHEGRFKSISEIVRQALKEFLSKNKPLDDMLREAFTETEGTDK